MHEASSSNRSLTLFFALVFVLAIPFWLVGAMTGTLNGLPMNLPMSALMFVCPLIAAIILVHKKEQPDGVKQLMTRVFDYTRIKRKIWFVPMIFIIPVNMLLSYGVLRLFGLPLSGAHIPLLMLPLLFVLFFISAAFEEVGWMGYAIEPMQRRWGALNAGIIVGIVWGVWHFIPLLQAGHSPAWIAGWFLGTVAVRIIMVWLSNNTGKSMFGAIFVHCMINVASSLFPSYDLSIVLLVTGLVTTIAAALITFLWGSRTLARYRYA